jgi:hypothetical protein
MHLSTVPFVTYYICKNFGGGDVWLLMYITLLRQVSALQRTNTEQIFPEEEMHGHSPNFHIHVTGDDLYITTIDLPILLREIHMWTDPGNI